MEEKKYQVFISSTFNDLKEERRKAVDVILTAGCIPAGMEAFVATDDEQFNVIKKVIDLCDYYVLILGGRYGTISKKTSKSYTEMEYDYAVEKHIPVLVMAYENIDNLPPEKKESNEILQQKFNEFKNKAMGNRLASIWTDINDLALKLLAAVMNAKNEFEMPGWVRGGKYNEKELLDKIYELSEENKRLKENVEMQKADQPDIFDDITFKRMIKLHYEENILFFTSGMQIGEKDIEISYEEIFKQISTRFLVPQSQKEFEKAIDEIVPGYHTSQKNILNIRAQFVFFGLITVTKEKSGKSDVEMISLTELGQKQMEKLNRV